MPRLAAAPIHLSESEQAELEQLVRRPSTAQQIALRAKIILRAGQGEGHGAISRGLGISKEMSRLWRVQNHTNFGLLSVFGDPNGLARRRWD
ncbi:MAG: hypothetical protein AAFU84_16300 [Cyanobacteria bacterium J06633_23]